MKYIFKYSIILFSIFLFSCSDNENISSISDDTATVIIKVANGNSAVSRSITDSNINTINNISVLIFNSDGENIGGKIGNLTSSSIEVKTRVASNCTIYAFANISDNSIFREIETIDELNNVCETISSPESLVNDKASIMSGKITNVSIIRDGSNSYSLSLEHIFSKVNFSIKTTDSSVKITDYQLCHVPLFGFLATPSDVSTERTYFNRKYGNYSKQTLSNSTSANFSYYMFENIAGCNSLCKKESDRYKSNAPENVTYLTFTATNGTWTTIYFVILGGVDQKGNSNVYSDFNVYRNKAYTINISVGANGAPNENNYRTIYSTEAGSFTTIKGTATIGDVFYDDGTTIKSATNTPIGIVFSNVIAIDDYLNGYTHGYVLALKNSSTQCYWSTDLRTMPTERGYSDVTLLREMTDMNGNYYTSKVIAAGNSSKYPACWQAHLYRSKDGITPETIKGTSGWFLPSFGQFYQLCINLGGMGDTTSGDLGYSKGTSWIFWSNYGITNNNQSTCTNAIYFANTINSIFSRKIVDKSLYDKFDYGTKGDELRGSYWSSSEYSELYAYRLALYSDDNKVDIGTKCQPKNKNAYHVRAILAY